MGQLRKRHWGSEALRLVELSDRFPVQPFLQVGLGQQAAGLGEVRFHIEAPPVFLNGLIVPSRAIVNLADIRGDDKRHRVELLGTRWISAKASPKRPIHIRPRASLCRTVASSGLFFMTQRNSFSAPGQSQSE